MKYCNCFHQDLLCFICMFVYCFKQYSLSAHVCLSPYYYLSKITVNTRFNLIGLYAQTTCTASSLFSKHISILSFMPVFKRIIHVGMRKFQPQRPVAMLSILFMRQCNAGCCTIRWEVTLYSPLGLDQFRPFQLLHVNAYPRVELSKFPPSTSIFLFAFNDHNFVPVGHSKTQCTFQSTLDSAVLDILIAWSFSLNTNCWSQSVFL